MYRRPKAEASTASRMPELMTGIVPHAPLSDKKARYRQKGVMDEAPKRDKRYAPSGAGPPNLGLPDPPSFGRLPRIVASLAILDNDRVLVRSDGCQ